MSVAPRALALAIIAALHAPGLLRAQERPDSLLDAVEAIPAGFDVADVRGRAADSLLHFDRDLTAALGQRAGAFTYDFGALGWPSGWSYLGASPNEVALYWNGIPFDDPLTGRPRFDLLPTALLTSPGVTMGVHTRPAAVLTRLRPFDSTRPLTELHYQAGDLGLQRVTAMHTQSAPRTILGQEGHLSALFGYGGATARGEYAGSHLRRMRQLLLRARFDAHSWNIEALYLHNQRRLGAHGGAIPAGSFNTIYNRLIALTRHDAAVRRDVRHDASLTLRLRLLEAPLTIQLWHTFARLRYTHAPQDREETSFVRWGLRLRQTWYVHGHRLRLWAEGFGAKQGSRAYVALRDSVRVGRFELLGEAGAAAVGGTVTGSGSLKVGFGRHLYAAAYVVDTPLAPIAAQGFGRFAAGIPDLSPGRVAQGRLGVRATWDALDVHLIMFQGLERGTVNWYGVRSDSMAVRVQPGTVGTTGVALDVGVRRDRPRGFYASAQALAVRRSDSGRNDVPPLSANARLGLRYSLFKGDLRIDGSVRARYWDAMTSRTLHAPTGLLVVPEDEALFPASGVLPASVAVDAVLEAWVRTAVLFIAYENALSGTPLQAGNLIVPTYPLPASRLRFGVFWPITN